MTGPCPFCGGRGRTTSEERPGYADFPDDPDRWAWSVVCISCAAVGPWHKSETAAVAAWSRRALTTGRLAAALHRSAPKNHNVGEGPQRAICQDPGSHEARADAILVDLERAPRERCAFVYTSRSVPDGVPCPFTREQHPLLHDWFDA